MIRKTFSLSRPLSLHMRCVSRIAVAASRFDADLRLEYNELSYDMTSVFSLNRVATLSNSFSVRADGADEEKALARIADVIADCMDDTNKGDTDIP